MGKPKITVCDDEPSIRKTLIEILEDEEYQVDTAASGEALLHQLRTADFPPDVILLDVWLPGMDGVETLAKIKGMSPEQAVIMISGHATMANAVKALRLGAYDFLEKPLNMDKVLVTIANALKQMRLEKRQSQLESLLPRVEMVGESSQIKRLKEDIALAAPSKGRVLLLGESGSGKEMAARMIHALSDRAAEPFVEMNCAAIPEELIESELFGHVKGSFTGAIENRQGRFLQADGGTLFLDEIGDMSLNTQAKVLRVLQEQRFQPVGSTKTITVDARVIAATNKDLPKEIAEGRFREDLYYRLAVIPITIPPLRTHAEDVPLLCSYFVSQICKEYGRKPVSFSQEALEVLARHTWPGNIRELRNVVERLVIMSRQETISRSDLPVEYSGETAGEAFPFGAYNSLKDAREAFERRYIQYCLEEHGGNVTKTAEALKIERSNLHKKMKQLDIAG